MSTPRILVALTSHGLLGNTGRTTGWYLPEVAHPHAVFAAAGFDVDFISPEGGEPPVDGADRADEIGAAFLADPETAEKLRTTPTPTDIDPADYDAIFFAGGHGTMWDFPDDVALATVASDIYEAGGVVGAVCHGPAGLVNAKLSDGRYLVDGKTVSMFTNEEEAAVGLTDVVPFLLETRLAERGARITTAPNFAAHHEVHERLVTGQNPASAAGVAERMVALVRGLTG
jgi:putative intracellular protease/amidase